MLRIGGVCILFPPPFFFPNSFPKEYSTNTSSLEGLPEEKNSKIRIDYYTDKISPVLDRRFINERSVKRYAYGIEDCVELAKSVDGPAKAAWNADTLTLLALCTS